MPSLISIDVDDLAINAASIMKENGISQLPVLKNKQVVGGINEVTLIKLLYDGVNLSESRVLDIMSESLPQIDESIDISEFYRLLMAGYGGVIVTKNSQAQGFLAKMDLADYWISKIANKEVANIK